jgi:hypothetical protein
MNAFKPFSFVLLAVFGALAVAAEKPILKVASDGFPSGHESPEGAACDLARAFIKRDAALFSDVSIRLYAGGKGQEEYARFLRSTTDSIKAEALKKVSSPGGPKSIGKAFAARHLKRSGPASYGYATFGFQDIMFVDVGVVLHDGERSLNRTLVIKDRDGKWYAHPLPSASSGMLAVGLNDEDSSHRDFSEMYEVQR